MLYAGYLKDKTCILVTHQIQYLTSVDQIVVMDNVSRILRFFFYLIVKLCYIMVESGHLLYKGSCLC